jgi:hypothetical protein
VVEGSDVRLGGPGAVPGAWSWSGGAAAVELLGEEEEEMDEDQRFDGEGV